jgi:hypothetical protein
MAVGYGKARVPTVFRPSQWSLAHATFYGDETARETMGMVPFFCFPINFKCCYNKMFPFMCLIRHNIIQFTVYLHIIN